MTSTLHVSRTMEQVVNDVLDHLAALQNVLYAKSASQLELNEVWRDVQIMASALRSGEELLSCAMTMNIEVERQRDAAIKAVAAQRAQWIQFAEKQARRVIATGVAMDKEGIDQEAVEAALDYLVGVRRGDVSEGAQWDVARALVKLAEELSQRGV